MDVIEQWFGNGKDFWEGVALLRRIGRDVRMFEPYMSENFVPAFYRESLQAAIESLSPQDLVEKKPVLISSHRPEKSETENETIVALRQEAKMLHKRHADRHAQLHLLETPELRHAVITEIMEEIIPGLDDIYDTIRNGGVRKKGVKLGDKEMETSVEFRQGIQEGFQKAQKLSYLKNRIFKLESKNGLINTEKDREKRLKFEGELTQKRNELRALEVELGITENE